MRLQLKVRVIMATVFVSVKPTSNGHAPANLIHAAIGKEAVPLLPVDIGNEKLNCIQAAEKAGVLVPHYCWHPALSVVASCRMCLVEVGELKDGKVLIPPKVFPGCQTPVKDGSVIVTGEYAKRDPNVKALTYPDKYVPGKLAAKAQADTLEGL